MKHKKLVKSEKTVITAGYLRLVSSLLLEEAKNHEDGKQFKIMASIVFSAFTLEAYLNHLGDRIIIYWSEIERNLNPHQKLEILSTELGIQINKGKRPFQSFREIFRFRNFLAHGKTENLESENIQIIEEGDYPDMPETDWQQLVNIQDAQIFFDDTEKMIDYLHDKSGLELNPLVVAESSHISISSFDE